MSGLSAPFHPVVPYSIQYLPILYVLVTPLAWLPGGRLALGRVISLLSNAVSFFAALSFASSSAAAALTEFKFSQSLLRSAVAKVAGFTLSIGCLPNWMLYMVGQTTGLEAAFVAVSLACSKRKHCFASGVFAALAF